MSFITKQILHGIYSSTYRKPILDTESFAVQYNLDLNTDTDKNVLQLTLDSLSLIHI
jgi:hypothetical protein